MPIPRARTLAVLFLLSCLLAWPAQAAGVEKIPHAGDFGGRLLKVPVIALSPDGMYLAAASAPDHSISYQPWLVHVWRLEPRRERINTMELFKNSHVERDIHAMAVNGKHEVLISDYNKVTLFNNQGTRTLWQVPCRSARRVCLIPGGFAALTPTGMELWDAKEKSRVAVLKLQDLVFQDMVTSPDGEKLLCTALDEKKQAWQVLWNLSSRSMECRTRTERLRRLSPDTTFLKDNGIQGFPGPVASLAFLPPGTDDEADAGTLLVGSGSEILTIAPSNGSIIGRFDTGRGFVSKLRGFQGRRRRHLAAVVGPRHVSVWYQGVGVPDRTLTLSHEVQALDVSPDGSLVALGFNPWNPVDIDAVQIWDAKHGILVRSLPVPSLVAGLDFSPDGRTLITGSVATGPHDDRPTWRSGRLDSWDPTTGKHKRRLHARRPIASFRDVEVSPDGKLVAAVVSCPDREHLGEKQRVALWNLRTGRRIRTLPKSDGIMKIAFAPNGKWIGGTGDQRLAIWDVRNGRLLRETRLKLDRTHTVASLAFSPDASLIVTSGPDWNINTWTMIEKEKEEDEDPPSRSRATNHWNLPTTWFRCSP